MRDSNLVFLTVEKMVAKLAMMTVFQKVATSVASKVVKLAV
jgi:hypothetical protein